jgi:hypothetical protein
MKGQAKRLERLKYQAFGFIRAGTSVPVARYKPLFSCIFLRAGPIYINKHPSWVHL